MAARRCPGCGRFARYDPYYARFWCDYCDREVRQSTTMRQSTTKGYTMRRLSLVFLVLLAVAACAKSPAGPPPPPSGPKDPYAIVGAIFAPGLYPDFSFVTRTIKYTGSHPTETLVNRYINLTMVCDELYTGSGFVADNFITVEWVVTDTIQRAGTDPTVIDTLARYVSAPLDPLNSPIPGWGDTPDHMVRWALRIDSLTPKVPLFATFVASTMPGFSYTDPSKQYSQADYCRQP